MGLTLYGVEIWAVALLFARSGAMLMLLPGFGETMVPPRIRLAFALALAVCIAPSLDGRMPAPADTVFGMAGQVITEVLIGVLLGGAARMLMAAVATAGQIIGLELGLSFAQTADPTMNQSGQLVAVFMSVLAMTLIFATDLHHMFLLGVAGSYEILAPGAPAPIADAAQMALGAASSSFRVGFQMTMPLIAAGLLFRVGMGVLSRLIPTIQVFFVALPLQMMGGFVVFALGLSAGMLIWLDSLQQYATWLR
jgi:flagellar biosynthesis protein FliR